MKQWKRGLAFFLAAVLMMSSMSVGVQAASNKSKKATVKSVTITKPDTKTLVLKKGKSYKLKTKVEVTGKASKKLQYTSSNKKVAKIDSKGKIKALKNGKSTITVKSVANKKKKATLKVIVGTPVTKVTLNKKTLSLTEGEKAALKATVSPKKPSVKKVSFTSDNKEVATVDSKGNVTAVKAGSAKITAKATDGSDKKAVCQVTVVKKQEPAKPQDPVKPTDPVETKVEVTGVTATISPATIKLGGKAQITATVAPSNATDKSLTYTSSDPKVATVNKSGKVTAKGYGTTTITVASTNGKKAEVKITVEKSKAPSATISENGIKQYEGYTLQWNDEFDGDSLDTENWNVETHEAGWVNAELQEYVNSEDNIKVVSGNLIISPVQTKNADGTYSYTSGRINTQGHQDYTYGLFEARVKVPEGKGYLPAFWMMPDENVYGQWPVCGEIDIMEVMGQETNKAYGTIHYGKPHKENQGNYVLEEDTFANDYHTFAVEWLPGELIWYVDGEEFYRTSDWYSSKDGQNKLTYPAPFDQPFHVILNLAVGGSWVGYPNDEDFVADDYCVDYVRIYQKTDGYDDSNVQAPEEDEVEAPTIGENLIRNGDFAVNEDLEEDVDWKFATAQNGVGSPTISNKAIHIATTNAGDVDYSIQLYQSNIPMKKGATYQVSYDAYADAPRKMMSKVSAPENGWAVYGGGNAIDLTTQKKTYTYTATASADDPYGRLEFNMGAFGSTATVHISNVSVKAISYEPVVEDDTKTVQSDGNYVYNGEFDQGANRLGYWEITNPVEATISVTDLDDGRRLKVVAPAGTSAEKPVVIAQSGLALTNGKFAFTCDVKGPASTTLGVSVAGTDCSETLTGNEQSIEKKLNLSNISNKNLVFTITAPGTYYLDNVRIVEDKLIKNGSFNAGLAGYVPYADGSASVENWLVDELNNDKAAVCTINDTGDADWKIQLKQNNVPLEKGQWYRLSLRVKSSIDRKFMYAIQRDGSEDNDWRPYTDQTKGEHIVALTSEWLPIKHEFQMKEETDLKAVLSLSMGAVGGTQITQKHDVFIDDIMLEKIDAPEKQEEEGDNVLNNADFSNGTEGWYVAETTDGGNSKATVSDNTITYDITSVGNVPNSIQLQQSSIKIEEGKAYRLSFEAKSSIARDINCAIQRNGDDRHGDKKYWDYATEKVALENKGADEDYQSITVDFPKDKLEADEAAMLSINMGKIDGTAYGAHSISLKNIRLVEVTVSGEEKPLGEHTITLSGFKMVKDGSTENMFIFDQFINTGKDGCAVFEKGSDSIVYTISSIGDADWNVQLKHNGLNLESGQKYTVTFKVTSTADRTIKTGAMSTGYKWYGGEDGIELKANVEKEVTFEFTMNKDGADIEDPNADFYVSMGKQ